MRRALALAALAAGCQDHAPPAPPAPASPVRPPPDAAPACTPHEHACRGDALVECTAAGAFGDTLQTCVDGCRAGACVDACAAQGVELVYVLTDDRRLLSFDPRKLPDDPFRVIGTLGCGLATPNSMAVDHAGIAWVVDHAQHLFRVSILDAHCAAAGEVAGDAPPNTFGMGFAATGSGSARAETLYVASQPSDEAGADGSWLGTVDTTAQPPHHRPIARLGARSRWNPELSGTGDGELFGYFPTAGGGGFVQAIDRRTGAALGKTWPVPSAAEVTAWAFAQWGGVFYVFATAGGNSQVHAIRRKTGAYTLVREHLPYRIVGAGVSTCAPVLERP